MKNSTFNQPFMKLFTLITLCFITFSFTTKLGLDSYEIYLNSKLLAKHHVNEPLSSRTLKLNEAKGTDQLRIKYTHCHGNGVGTGRSISIKDEMGNTLKKWEFADVADSNLSMTLSVKELLQLEKKNGHKHLSLHYIARELPKGEMLAALSIK